MLGALREAGLEDRTTVLFCADHGEMLGERGLWYKMSFLEQSARVPLIVRAPGAAGRGARVAGPVSLVDFAPTVLELAGLETDAIAGEGDGVSLAGAIGGGAAASPARAVVSEYHAEGVQAPSAMVRSGRHKLIVSREDPDLLYDLEADPRELTDVSGSADGARDGGAVARRSSNAGSTSTTSTPGCGRASASASSSPGRCARAGPRPGITTRPTTPPRATSATARTSTSSSGGPGWTAGPPSDQLFAGGAPRRSSRPTARR